MAAERKKKPAKVEKPSPPAGGDGLLEGLNERQAEAVTRGAGPLLIVAGAGTGKTTVITRRIARAVSGNLAKPEEILALTFTEKAATEMRERVDLILPLGYADTWISTFHSFCQRVLEERGLEVGLPDNFRLLTEAEQWVLVHDNLHQFELDYYRPLGNPSKFISAMLKHFSRCKDELITPDDYLKYAGGLKANADVATEGPASGEAARATELANAYHTYQRLLLGAGALDFGDLISYALKLFRERPAVLARYQDKFKLVLVDEFQDTNYAQYELVKLIAQKHQNLTVVGDDDQSIYKFRGASVSNILAFRKDYPSAAQVTLVENYRSSQNILDLAYNFIQHNNPDRLEVALGIDKRLKASAKEAGVVAVIEGTDQTEELHLVVKKMIALKDGAGDQASWNDFGVLVRSNAGAEELLPVLAAYGVPHTFVASTGLYRKTLISDLISYLRLLVNVHDPAAMYRALQLPHWKLEPQELALLLQESVKRTRSLFEVAARAREVDGLSPEAARRAAALVELVQKHAAAAQTRGANEVFVEAVSDLHVEDLLKEETPENVENRELLEQFYRQVEEFVQRSADRGVHGFLHELDLRLEAGDEGQIQQDPNLGPESAKVMTVHSAKGLEFTYVFVVGMVEQRFPTRARGESLELPAALIKDQLPSGDFHLEEERRLFYVAVTRAKRHLYLSWAKDYGGKTLKKPSPFLVESGLLPAPKEGTKATGRVVFGQTAPTAKKAVYKDLPTKFSYSALRAFETCPLQYKYQYYLKMPSPGSAALSFGQTIHRVLERYLKEFRGAGAGAQADLFAAAPAAPVLPPKERLAELYDECWIDEWYKTKIQKAEYRARGQSVLEHFYRRSEARTPTPKYLEQPFKLPLGPYQFTGRIDRMDETHGGLYIFDYKTGEKVPEKSDKPDLDQLYIYQWAAEEFLSEPVAGMTYWYLCPDQLVEEELATPERLGELKDGFLKTIERIVHVTEFDLFSEEHEKVRDHRCAYRHLA